LEEKGFLMSNTHEHEDVEHGTIEEYIESLSIIDNEKLSYAMSKLCELFEHMHERNGRPDPSNFENDGIEGAISVNVTLTLPPHAIYKQSDLKIPRITSVSLHASLLHRENKNNPVQWFKTMDGFLNQVDNWHKHEMSLPIPEEK
jgi:hypothetical protein